ncbi:hypothetical protein BDW75DRAFT_205046 [Aspergillus navahoensis]
MRDWTRYCLHSLVLLQALGCSALQRKPLAIDWLTNSVYTDWLAERLCLRCATPFPPHKVSACPEYLLPLKRTSPDQRTTQET